MFDFYHNSYSLVTGLFAAIFGMAFPLVLQCVQRIDEKYDSSVVSREFENEWTFKAFKCLLFPYIIIVCLSPLVLGYLKENTSWSYVIQCFMLVYVLAIAIVLILLFGRITEYYNIDKLLKGIKVKDPARDVLKFFDIAKYASRKGYQDLYIRAMSMVSECFIKERKQAGDGITVEYSESLKRVLREIARAVGNENDGEFLYKFNDITNILYDSSGKTLLSNSTYSLLWFMLNNAAYSGNNEWIKGYWTWTNQHHQFNVRNPESDSSKKFYQFNIMVGAMLVFNKRYECLYHITTFSQSTFEGYTLIPDTLSKIQFVGEELDSMFASPMLIESLYGMKGLDRGVNTGNAIIAQAYKYLALLVIRIWSYRDYNFTYSNPLTIPIANPNSADSNENRIRILEILKNNVCEWLDSDAFETIRYTNIPEKKEVIDTLDQCISECEKMITKIDAQSGYDKEKLQHILDEAIKVNANCYKVIPGENELPNKVNSSSIERDLFGVCPVEKRFLQKGRGAECGGIGTIIVQELIYQYFKSYKDELLDNFTIEKVTVGRDKIQDYLDSLDLTASQVIVNFSNLGGLNTSAEILNLGKIAKDEGLFVCDKNDLPSSDIVKIESPDDYQLIDEYNLLYSRVEEKTDIFRVFVAQKYKFKFWNEKKNAKMIIIDY